MSAVAAIWRPASDHAPEHLCARMLVAQHRYGPHGFVSGNSRGAALGRAMFRLLPEDALETGLPRGGDGNLLIAADLRLDNRTELASKLGISSAELLTLSDAAVLVRAWARWEDAVFPHLLGDYAFAVFDSRRNRLSIARDPLGQRPLFWSRTPDRIAVASMPSGLHALPDQHRRPDAERVARLLAFADAGQRSFFEGMQRVEPGHVVHFDEDKVAVRSHWQPAIRRLALSRFPDYVDAYREQLDRATDVRLRRTDRPIAAHLSGGWDSSAVTGTAARLLAGRGERLTAYTSVPSSAPVAEVHQRFSDEGPLAASVAAFHANIDHVLVEGRGVSPIADLVDHPRLYGRPMVNLCNHVWLKTIREDAAAAGTSVVLTGEIGNFTISGSPASLLADYVRAGRWFSWSAEAYHAVRSNCARLRGVVAQSFEPWIPSSIWKRLHRFAATAHHETALCASPTWRARLSDELMTADAERRRQDYYTNTLANLRRLDFGEYHKGVLGGWGIDKRDPTADIRVVEFMLSLPPEMFLSGGVRRPLARAALSDRVPASVLDQKRKGYQAADWHEGLTADLPRIRTLVARISDDPVAAQVIDIPLIQRLVADWPRGGWTDPQIIARYRTAFLTALSAGYFLVAA